MLRGDQVVNPVVLGGKDKEDPIEVDFFRLYLVESVKPFRSLTFSTGAGFKRDAIDFSIRVEVDSLGGFVSLTGSRDKDGREVCRLIDVRSSDVFVAEANSLTELRSKNAEYFEEELLPLLKSLGMQW